MEEVNGEWQWVGKTRLLAYGYVEKKLKRLLGEILTLVDASILDPGQNKAMKDVIKSLVYAIDGECMEFSMPGVEGVDDAEFEQMLEEGKITLEEYQKITRESEEVKPLAEKQAEEEIAHNS